MATSAPHTLKHQYFTVGKPPLLHGSVGDFLVIQKRLTREIECLEKQLLRLRQQSSGNQKPVLGTYEEMIHARREMLDQLTS